jgi:HAD superfamily hydrolase (TIGR01509 family)
MKQQYTVGIIHNQCRPRFNHEFALSKLKAEGYRIVVCSNSIRMTIEMMMSYAKLSRYLEFIISNQDIKNAKPDPEIYLLAMEKMKLRPEECLICEDNENGIEAAITSGGHLLTIRTVDNVNYGNIKTRIAEIEEGGK